MFADFWCRWTLVSTLVVKDSFPRCEVCCVCGADPMLYAQLAQDGWCAQYQTDCLYFCYWEPTSWYSMQTHRYTISAKKYHMPFHPGTFLSTHFKLGWSGSTGQLKKIFLLLLGIWTRDNQQTRLLATALPWLPLGRLNDILCVSFADFVWFIWFLWQKFSTTWNNHAHVSFLCLLPPSYRLLWC